MLALDTAERIGAVAPASWHWLEGQWVHVPAEVRKNGRRDRRYFISSTTCGLINRIRQYRADDELIFPWPYSKQYLWQKYDRILQDARLPHGREDKFHRLRKTTASVVHAAGMNAQEALDHQNRRTTRRYIDPRFVQSAKPSDEISKFLSTPTETNRRRRSPKNA